jgi:hypothetical protein
MTFDEFRIAQATRLARSWRRQSRTRVNCALFFSLGFAAAVALMML